MASVSDRQDIRFFPGRPMQLPKDQHIFELQFWPMRKAAKEWGCSYQTARRWVLLHPEVAVLVRVWSARSPVPRWKLCVFAGQPKFDRREGASHFRSSAWQRSMVNRRWRRQRAADRAADLAAGVADQLPTPHYGRCRQPIPGTNFPTSLPQLHKRLLPSGHKPLPGQIDIAEALKILSRPLPRG